MAQAYCPERGDVVWVSFSPQSGHEQAGDRPALVLSPKLYNQKSGLAILCPITAHEKEYPFEVKIPSGHKVTGAVLADHLKSLDWKARHTRFYCKLPPSAVSEVIDKIAALLQIDVEN